MTTHGYDVKNPKVLMLFDIDGTLTMPRLVRYI
jgi:hypothetical protein